MTTFSSFSFVGLEDFTVSLLSITTLSVSDLVYPVDLFEKSLVSGTGGSDCVLLLKIVRTEYWKRVSPSLTVFVEKEGP